MKRTVLTIALCTIAVMFALTAVLHAEATYDAKTNTVTVMGKENSLKSVAQAVANPDVFSYDYIGKEAVCGANILVERGELTLAGETLRMNAARPKTLTITIWPAGSLQATDSTITGPEGTKNAVWGIDVNGSGGTLIARDSEFVNGGIHNGTGSSPKIVLENVAFRGCETPFYIYFPPTPDSRFDRLTIGDCTGQMFAPVGKGTITVTNSTLSAKSRPFYFARDGKVETVNCTPARTGEGDILFEDGAAATAGWINKMYLNLQVVDRTRKPVSGAAVTIKDKDGAVEYSGQTGADGYALLGAEKNIPLTDFVWTKKGQADRNPHTVTVVSEGKTVEDTVTMKGAVKDKPVIKAIELK